MYKDSINKSKKTALKQNVNQVAAVIITTVTVAATLGTGPAAPVIGAAAGAGYLIDQKSGGKIGASITSGYSYLKGSWQLFRKGCLVEVFGYNGGDIVDVIEFKADTGKFYFDTPSKKVIEKYYDIQEDKSASFKATLKTQHKDKVIKEIIIYYKSGKAKNCEGHVALRTKSNKLNATKKNIVRLQKMIQQKKNSLENTSFQKEELEKTVSSSTKKLNQLETDMESVISSLSSLFF